MKVVVFGASGGVGKHLVRIAAARGHAVTAVARGELAVPPGVRLFVGDVTRPDVVDGAVAGQDAVLSALGIRRRVQANPWSALTSPPDFTSSTARAIVAAMRTHGVRRVIAVSAAGVGDSRPRMNGLMRAMIALTNIGKNYADLEVMEREYGESGLDTCCVRPTGLTDGPETGRVRVQDDFPLNAWISRADVAAWMVDHLEGDLTGLRTPTISEAT